MLTIVRAVIFLLTVRYAFGQQYFPSDILGRDHKEDEFRNQWYSKHFRALREPSLWETSKQNVKTEQYRFLYLRSFHHPVLVRLVVDADKASTLISKETSGKEGYEPGRLIRNRQTHLTKLQTEAFLAAPNDLHFWNLSTLLHEENNNVVQLDGAQWILEGTKEGQYHIVDRYSPDRTDDPIRIIGTTLMIDLAHFKFLYRDVY